MRTVFIKMNIQTKHNTPWYFTSYNERVWECEPNNECGFTYYIVIIICDNIIICHLHPILAQALARTLCTRIEPIKKHSMKPDVILHLYIEGDDDAIIYIVFEMHVFR